MANRKTWRCFHCDEVFRSPRLAAEHFGDEMYSTPACQIGGLRPMVTLIRDQERQLRSYRAEDTNLLRALWSIESDHRQALRREEERGYERGLKDGMNERACAGLEIAQS